MSLTRPSLARCAAIAAALVVTACGQVHPGAAAVVGGTRVSFDELDSLSAAYCRASVAIAESQGRPAPPAEGIDSRRRVLGALVQLELAKQAAASLGVEAPPSSYEQDPQGFAPLVEAAGAEYADAIQRLFQINNEAAALQIAIGAHQLGQDVATVDQQKAQVAGQEYVAKFADGVNVDIDPRLAVTADGKALADTGSLSVPVSGEAETLRDDPAGNVTRLHSLPATQVCS